jgi:hypothetical protein
VCDWPVFNVGSRCEDYNAAPRRGVHILFHNQRAREMESGGVIEGRGKILDQK